MTTLALFSASFLALACGIIAFDGSARAGDGLVEPTLHVTRGAPAAPQVALTLDACSGRTDDRILAALVDNEIPATIFVTARWLKHNPQALAVLESRPDLFEIENHGENHVPAVDRPTTVYGIAAAGSPAAVASEVEGGAEAIRTIARTESHWFRGATAKYSKSSMAQIEGMGFRIAGYSVNGDGGSLLPASIAERHIAGARDGDVIIAHINQPTHEAGAGVVRGILALKAKGFVFTRLDRAPSALVGKLDQPLR